MFASFEHRAAKIFVLIALTVLARRLTRHLEAQARENGHRGAFDV
jgi:hypothetical protein